MSKKQSRKTKILISVMVLIFTLSIISITMAVLSIKDLISENINRPNNTSQNNQNINNSIENFIEEEISSEAIVNFARQTIFFFPWKIESIINHQMKLEQLIIDEPKNANAKAALAENIILQSYFSYDNYDEHGLQIAQELLDEAFLLDPDSFIASDVQIGLYLKTNKNSDAQKLLTKTTLQHPDKLELIAHELEILNKTGKPQQALSLGKSTLNTTDDLKAQIIIHRQFVDSYSRLGGDCKNMKASMEEVVKLQPENPWSLINLADLLLQCTFDWEEVINLSSRSLEQAETPMGHIILAKGYHKQGELLSFKNQEDEAREFYILAVQHDPENAEHLKFLGTSYMIKGEDTKDIEVLDEAEILLIKSLEYEPGDGVTKGNLTKVRDLKKELNEN